MVIYTCTAIGFIKEYLCIPVRLAAIPFVEQVLWSLPCVIIAREVLLTTVCDITVTGTNLTIHKERCLVQSLVLILLTEGCKLRNELLAEGKT